MKQVVIGIDTSCYTTSAAAVTTDGQVIASCRKLLPVAEGKRGLRQSEMVFIHTRQLPEQIEALSGKIRGMEVKAVCASVRPRDDEESYMPAFHVGDAQARSLAAILGVPCFASTHQRGHIAAAAYGAGLKSGDFLAVHLSGGTTQILSMRSDDLQLLGGSLDLHAGQVVDRVGVALGLPFPAGPHLEELARQGSSKAILPVNMADGDLHCHLSGAESALQRMIAAGTMNREDIAMEVYDLLARTVSRMILGASAKTGIRQVLVAGGVASSTLFRQLLTERIRKKDRDFHICFGRPEFSGDNAVGAALIGAEKLKALQQIRQLTLDPCADVPQPFDVMRVRGTDKEMLRRYESVILPWIEAGNIPHDQHIVYLHRRGKDCDGVLLCRYEDESSVTIDDLHSDNADPSVLRDMLVCALNDAIRAGKVFAKADTTRMNESAVRILNDRGFR